MMAYILDIVLILIIAVTTILGFRRGFLRSVVQLAGLIASFVLAFTLSATVADWLYDSMLEEPIKETVSAALVEDAMANADKSQAVLDSLPAPIANALNSSEAARDALENLSNKAGESVAAAADVIVDDVVRPLTIVLVRFVLFMVMLIVFILLARLLTKMIKPLTNLPLIHQADGLLGGAVGLVKGALFVIVAVTVMQLLASAGILVTYEQLDNSMLAGWVAEHNLISAGLELI